MATKIEAINAYRPKVVLNPLIKLDQLVDFIAMRTGLNKGSVQLAIAELSDAVVFFNLQGSPVKIEGLGIYTPSIDTEGALDSGHRTDQAIVKALNVPGAFKGIIENRDNIGKTTQDFITKWNTDHPNDPVVA